MCVCLEGGTPANRFSIPHERTSGSKWNIDGFNCNITAIFFDNQILANRFVLKVKLCKNSSAIFPIDFLLIVMRSEEIVWHLSQRPLLNTTCGNMSCS